MSNTTFPITIDSPAYDPQTTDTLASAVHHTLHGFANDAILAIEQKLGQGSSLAASGTILVGIGPSESEWLSSLTSFSITTSFLDANNKTWIGQTATSGAVDYINIGNSSTGNAPTISVLGTDNNISLNLVPKGSGKVQDNGTNLIDFRSSFANFVSSGLIWSTGSGLVGSMTSGTLFINGAEYSVGSVASHTFGASDDTYIDYTVGTGLVYTAVANNSASPSLAANSIRLAIVVSGASALSSINQGQTTATAPIVSNVVYAVTDSLGNLIYPTNPHPSMIGYRQYTGGTFTGSGSTPTQITGLSTGVIIPSNSPTVKVSIFGSDLYAQTGAAVITLSIYSGTTQGALTTVINSSTPNVASGTASTANVSAYLRSPTAGLIFYSAAISATASNGRIDTSTITPCFIVVELE